MSKKKNAAPKAGKPSANATAAAKETKAAASTNDAKSENGRDWGKTLFLPKTAFPMKAGLPKLEPKLLERWEEMKLFQRMRKEAKGREKFTLHDGPPYANGNIHIGHALNKLLKDMVSRSQSMLGKDSNYVPGWDCHGLPIEWKIEEQYRAKGKNKDEVPVVEFRRECREFAEHWIDVQREEFKRLGVEGDWQNPYTTMSYEAESIIADELMKFAMNGTIYEGSKPVMWSVVERTALAEAEVEYKEHVSHTIFVKFPLEKGPKELKGASVVIWTTTPWTIPGNRAIAYSSRINYGLYEVTDSPEDNWAKVGDRLVIADGLAENLKNAARIEDWKRVCDVDPSSIKVCRHPFHAHGYDFQVRLYEGDFVTDDTGTGFVHIAPGHGGDDYELYVKNKASFAEAGIPEVPHTVGEDGYYFKDVPLFGGAEPKRVINDKGKFAGANDAVIEELVKANALVARGKLAIDDTRFVPQSGQNRLRGMLESRPDWVLSRQRAWGVPITIFQHQETGEVIPNAKFKGAKELIKRITAAFREEGADAWFMEGARERFLDGLVDDPSAWKQITDILDVWFDSGSTHVFVLEARKDLSWPADLYLEGSDQHRGWFHSSLLETCGTRGRAPYDAVLTHGFILNEKGEKLSKSEGNAVSPQAVTKQFGAEIMRLWVASADYSGDLRYGPNILQSAVETYRKLRNTLRFTLGNLAHYDSSQAVPYAEMPELERYILHRLAGLDNAVRTAYNNFDFKRVFSTLFNFCTVDLSSQYFDIRKDALYCEPHSSLKRRACLTVLDELFNRLTVWLSPILCFTTEEAYLARFPEAKDSIHLKVSGDIPEEWQDDKLAAKWEKIWAIRRVVTGALEIERREKRIGSSLEAAPVIYIEDDALYSLAKQEDWAEIAITSAATLHAGKTPGDAFRLEDVEGVAVVPSLAKGKNGARSWRILLDVGSDAEFPELSPRDAAAVREFDALGVGAGA
ncbi:MAG: isoleucine--tRNA ligase [Alphaproteobacteria bacterium]